MNLATLSCPALPQVQHVLLSPLPHFSVPVPHFLPSSFCHELFSSKICILVCHICRPAVPRHNSLCPVPAFDLHWSFTRLFQLVDLHWNTVDFLLPDCRDCGYHVNDDAFQRNVKLFAHFSVVPRNLKLSTLSSISFLAAIIFPHL